MTEKQLASHAFLPMCLGVAWIALLALLAGVNGWLFTSELAPLVGPNEPDFLLVACPFSYLAAWCVGALAVLGGLHALYAARHFRWRHASDALHWRHVAYLSPLLLLAFPIATLATLKTPLRTSMAPWLYLFVDLRWWFFAGVALLLALAVDSAAGRTWQRPTGTWLADVGKSPRSRLWLDTTLVATLLVAALATSPANRFETLVLGDEPQYLRYLETWYRGRGTNIINLVPIRELPADYQPDLPGNVRHLVSALSLMTGDLAADARRAVGLDAPPRPGPAWSRGGEYIEGKRGGVYQVHSPGLAALTFPGYFIDRYFLNWSSAYFHPQFPANLYCTNTTILILYLLWGVGLFRLLEAYAGQSVLAWLLACVAMLSLPAAAFNYQYYPEAAAGLLLVFVTRHVVVSTDMRMSTALWYGLLAGYLPWLHVRFASAAILAGVAIGVTRYRSWRTVIAFWIGLAIPLAALSLYNYHIAGSLLPTAVWSLMRDHVPVFNVSNFSRGFIGFGFDTYWGLLAHSPVYVLAFLGVWQMWRRSPRTAILVSLFVLAIAVPAAGHNWRGSGTTPLRLVTSVVPLATIPLIDAAVRYGRSRWFVMAFAVLSIISIQNGLTFNHNFLRLQPLLIGPTFSGWLSPLLMPNLDADDWLTNPLLIAWLAGVAVLMAWPALESPSPRIDGAVVSWTGVTAIVVAVFAAASSALGAWTGVSLRTRFMGDPQHVRERVLKFVLSHQGSSYWAARRDAVDIAAVFPNPNHPAVGITLTPQAAPVQAPMTLTVDAAARDGMKAWGTVLVDFGDGTLPARSPLLGSTSLRHAYSAPGEYTVRVDVALAGARSVRRTERARVAPLGSGWPFNAADSVAGFQSAWLKRPVAMTIDSVAIGQSRLDLRCTLISGGDRPDAEYWVWVFSFEDDSRRARLYKASRVPRDTRRATDRSFTLSVAPDPRPDGGKPGGLLVGIRQTPGQAIGARSNGLEFAWPRWILTTGSPVVVLNAP